MKESRRRLLSLSDERIPAMRTMLGTAAADMLGAAATAAGLRIMSARPAQVSWRPGRSLVVRYEARLEGGSAEQFVAAAGHTSEPVGGVTLLERGDERVTLWRLQDDPRLPGLAVLFNDEAVRRLLDHVDAPPGRVRRRLRSYRPGRRAVVELDVAGLRLFAKAVPPEETQRLQARHRLLRDALPVPRSHGWSQDHGLVLMEAMPGASLRAALAERGERLPSPAALEDVLDRIPRDDAWPRVPAPQELARDHIETLRHIMPELTPRLAALADAIGGCRGDGALVPVHGDFYEAQVLVRDGEVSGLLDVDTCGLGRRSDDWATMIAHLTAWQDSLPPPGRERVQAYARRVLERALAATGDDASLRLKVASVILGLAIGPFRVQADGWPGEMRRRVRLAEEWAGVRDERDLTPSSAPVHAAAAE